MNRRNFRSMMPNKKMKISVSSSEEERNYANSDYFNKLPDDVITSLFLRCSLKSLSMLRCTSKLWNNFTISPSFIHSHLTQSRENGPKLLFLERKCCYRSKSSRLRFVSVDMDGSREELYTVTAPDTQLSVSAMRVCYGLVCLLTDCHFYGYDHFGFGYLHSRNEYKIGHFFYKSPRCLPTHLHLAQLKFEFLTLNRVGGVSFNGWKEIAGTPPGHPCLAGLLVTECMYWLTMSEVSGRVPPTQIVSFDFENEKFLTISSPTSFKARSRPIMMDLKGMLFLSDIDHFCRSSILNLWILKDKISCTWVYEYSVNLVDFGYKDILYFNLTFNEEIIFQPLGTVVFYDLKTKCFREVETLGLKHYGIYSKSLFSLGSI